MTRLAASTLVLSPLFALASSAVAPRFESDPGAQLAVIAADPARWYWFTLLLLVSSLLLVPAVAAIGVLVRGRLGLVGGSLAVLGSLIAIGDVMSQFFPWQMVTAGADRAQMAALMDRVDNAAGVSTVYSVGGLAVLVGVALLTVGLIRGRRAPAWAAIGLTVACVVNVAAFTAASNAAVAVSWALLLVSMGAIARPLSSAARGDEQRLGAVADDAVLIAQG
jgi:hypothetical protein